MNQAALSKPPATSYRPVPVRQVDALATVLVVGESPVGSLALRSLLGSQVHVESEADLQTALQRCLREPVDMLFVNLFRCRPSEWTALATFRQTRPEQYVAACAEQSLVEPLEQAGLVDALFILEGMQ